MPIAPPIAIVDAEVGVGQHVVDLRERPAVLVDLARTDLVVEGHRGVDVELSTASRRPLLPNDNQVNRSAESSGYRWKVSTIARRTIVSTMAEYP